MYKKAFFDYYNRGREVDRYARCEIEFIRTKDILRRYITKENAYVLDMGGGAGYYSFHLSAKGHHVDLRDIVPLHIEQAKMEESSCGIKLNSIEIGDAMQIEFPDNTFDYVLLMGPLYHLQDLKSRLKVLREAKRVLKPNGLIFAVFIGRTSALVDGFHLDAYENDIYVEMVEESLHTGIYNDRRGNKFTHAYMHKPEEIFSEIVESGLVCESLIGIEGIHKVVSEFNNKIQNDHYLDLYLRMMEKEESNPNIFGFSDHLMAIIKKSE